MFNSKADTVQTTGRRFKDANLLQIAMPMGGIGSGSVSLNGHGGIQDLAIRHKPRLTASAAGHDAGLGAFATLHTRATPTHPTNTRLVEGPLPRPKVYDQGLQGMGLRNIGHAGLPRFSECEFEASYPSGVVRLSDTKVPLAVTLTGWSPLIPLDDHHSSIPCAILEYELHNPTRHAVEYALCFHLAHLASGKSGWKATRNHVIPGRGVLLNNKEPELDPTRGSLSLTCGGRGPTSVKAMWFRGAWFDWLMALWRETSAGAMVPNDGLADDAPDQTGINGASIQMAGALQPGGRVTYPVVLTWHFPNIDQFHGQPKPEEPCCDPSTGCCPPKDAGPKIWHPYYAAHWRDAREVADTVHEKFDLLREKTFAFRDALHGSTLPAEAVDAIASNLAILKSPTILRQANGNLWGWEGCMADSGCCHGTCTHVWNYAQALPHLFPALERGLREQELERSMNELGHVTFRAALPDGPTPHGHHAAADGQFGGIMKVYRDWQIGGDERWLRRIYPKAKKSIDYCIRQWDPDRKGGLFEPHHNTYDVEFWGPDGMCGTVYCGALAAMAMMASHLGEKADAESYRMLADRAATYMAEHLFNGDYYQQTVMWKELNDSSFRDSIARLSPETATERDKVLLREGPPYQYATGCLSDGVIGAWMADLYGIDHAMNVDHIRRSLDSIHQHNFKSDLWDHACLQRPGYANGHEAGLLTCSWPRGERATIPFPYCDEVFTGIEYQVASHLILHGRVEQGMQIVRGARGRYDGHVRNPFNEYECGNYYARALSSYALLQALSGFTYSAAQRLLTFAPHGERRPFRSFFCTEAGYGTIEMQDGSITVQLLQGELPVDTLVVGRERRRVEVRGVARVGKPLTIKC